jgi:hypothetical protein
MAVPIAMISAPSSRTSFFLSMVRQAPSMEMALRLTAIRP